MKKGEKGGENVRSRAGWKPLMHFDAQVYMPASFLIRRKQVDSVPGDIMAT